MKKTLALFALSTLALTGCVSREQADETLAKGCTAAIEIYLTSDNKIKEIKNKSFGPSIEEGLGYRQVTIDYVESDGWADVDKKGTCVFIEEFGPLNTAHRADIYQVQVNNQVYGKKGGEILGSYEDLMKLSESVGKAMGKIE